MTRAEKGQMRQRMTRSVIILLDGPASRLAAGDARPATGTALRLLAEHLHGQRC